MTPHTYLDHGITIFNTRNKAPGAGSATPFSPPTRPFLTISREACAGATTLGLHLVPLLDAQLGEEGRSWMFLDKDLLTRALTTNNLPEQLADFLPEDRISDIKGMIGEIVGLHPPLWELEQRVNEAIRQFAQMGRVIFAGRAAHIITGNLPGGFHLRLVAPLGLRVKRLQEQQGCDRETATRILQETDNARRRYVQSNFEQDINDPHAYDMVLNTEHIQPDTAAQLVLRAMLERVTAPAVTV